MNADEQYARRALELAGTAMGETFPNPLVGALIVRDGEIAGEGYHRGAGHPHAEIEAIRAAGERSRGATLYLNLEPCCHEGRTPPCTGGIVEAGIARVVFSMYDPDARVRGKGAAALRSRGVDVVSGVLAADALELNLPYVHRSLTGEPFVVIKLASTLDGRLTWGDERRLSGDAEQRYVHRLRAWTEAIAIGIGTIEKDAPRLDRRFYRGDMAPPVRMVFDSELRFPHDYPWLVRGERVIVYCSTHGDRERRTRLEAAGAEIVPLPAGPGGVDLEYWLDDVAEKGITSVLVEGGGEVATSFIREGFFERLVLCYAPLVGGAEAVGWYQGEEPPEWLAEEGLALSRLEALDNDVAAVYDSPSIAGYLETVTEEEKIVHWTD
jgi:diaminohydroxyphosphoribosylaminopyrimidine deaminase/5-amino-6-(5-phosphoribosylamino)uracil reductase